MLKEYLSDAVSLLTEAVLGKPVRAQAGCGRPVSQASYTVYGNCFSCGVMKMARGYVWLHPYCRSWVDCVIC